MTNFVSPYRSEPPRVRVHILSVDTVNLTAVGVEEKNKGAVTIDLSVHNSQTVIYPRENEEWYLTKINEIWVLDKKGGFGTEGLLREASPGDLVTVTDGNYVLDTGPVSIEADTTVEGHLTADTDFTVWGNTDVGNIQIYGTLDQRGDLHMHGYKIWGEGGPIDCGQINCGNIYAQQIVAFQNSFVNANLQANQMHCLGTFTTGYIDNYGGIHTNGWGIDTQGGRIDVTDLVVWRAEDIHGTLWVQNGIWTDRDFHGGGVYCNGVDVGGGWVSNCARFQSGSQIMDYNGMASNYLWCGNALHDGGGFGIGNAQHNGGGFGVGACWMDYWNVEGYNVAWVFLVGYSSEQLKQNITDVDHSEALDQLMNIRVREFEWRQYPEQGRTLGFVVEELPERFRRYVPENEAKTAAAAKDTPTGASTPTATTTETPNATSTEPPIATPPSAEKDENGNDPLRYGYNLPEIVAVTVAASKAQQENINDLTSRVSSLESTVSALTARLEALGG